MPKSKPPRKKSTAKARSQSVKNDLIKDLHRLDHECERAFAEVSRLAPFFLNRELVQAGDVEQINNSAKILNRDVMQLRKKLDQIRTQIPKQLNPEDPNDVMLGLKLGEQYNEWQNEYQMAVMPTVQRLAALFSEASNNLVKENGAQEPVTETEKDSDDE